MGGKRSTLKLREERGQMALTVVSIAALIAVAAFVLDVGAWFQGHRATQAVADAAALAGAQALPNTVTAGALALEYSAKNGGGVAAGDIGFESSVMPNDTIRVTARRTSAGFLSKILGVSTVNLTADAAARAYTMKEATYAAPFGITRDEPLLTSCSGPCFEQPTSFELNRIGPGGFEILNIDGSSGGIGPSTLADWIASGLDSSMPLGWYSSDPGAKFNPSQVQGAMNGRIDSVLLFPVYDAVRKQGANLEYRVVGWAGFYLTGWSAQGGSATITGYLKSVAWEGLPSDSSSGFFGAVTVKLVG